MRQPGLQQAREKISQLIEVVGVDAIDVVAKMDFLAFRNRLDAKQHGGHTMIESRPGSYSASGSNSFIRRSAKIQQNQLGRAASRALYGSLLRSRGINRVAVGP